MTAIKRNYKLKNRTVGLAPVRAGETMLLPPNKKYTCSPVLGGPFSRYKDKGYVIHINTGTKRDENIAGLGANNCAVFLEVGLIIGYGQSIGKVIDDWSDADFTGFGQYIANTFPIASLSSSFNEAYEGSAPYAVDMAAKPVVAYKMQRAIAIAINAKGGRYKGEYSGTDYPLERSDTMSNSSDYRPLLNGSNTANQACYNSLRGVPNAGTPNLMHLGDSSFSTDLHQYKDILLDNYFEPGLYYQSGRAYMLATLIQLMAAKNALAFLNNNTAKVILYGFSRAQERNTQFFHTPLGAAIGGRFTGSDFIGYHANLIGDTTAFGWILGDEVEFWDDANKLYGSDNTIMQPDFLRFDGLPMRQYVASGTGNHNPGRADTTYAFDSAPRGFVDSPRWTWDIPFDAAEKVYAMYQHVGNTTPVFFPVRKAGSSTWGKTTQECTIDAFEQNGAFAVGYTDNVGKSAYMLFSFSPGTDNSQLDTFEIMCAGNVIQTERAAMITGKFGYSTAA